MSSGGLGPCAGGTSSWAVTVVSGTCASVAELGGSPSPATSWISRAKIARSLARSWLNLVGRKHTTTQPVWRRPPSRVQRVWTQNNNPEDYRDQPSVWRPHGQTQTAMAVSWDFCEVTSRAIRANGSTWHHFKPIRSSDRLNPGLLLFLCFRFSV